MMFAVHILFLLVTATACSEAGDQQKQAPPVAPLVKAGGSEGTAITAAPLAVKVPSERQPEKHEQVSASVGTFEYRFDPGQMVRGHVAFPEGTPEDEQCRVHLLASRPLELGPGGEVLAPAFGLSPYNKQVVASVQVEVGTNGDFELPIPNNAVLFHLEVRGRYLYDGMAELGEEGQWKGEPTLRPRLGAWLTLKLTPPDGQSFKASALPGRRLSLVEGSSRTPESTRRSMSSYTGQAWNLVSRIDPDLRVEFHGLNPTIFHSVGLAATRKPVLRPFVLKENKSIALQAGVHHIQRAALVMGSQVRGRVANEAGQEIDRATVSIECVAQNITRKYHTETAADGSFELSGLEGKPVGMVVQKLGYVDGFLSAIPDAQEVESIKIELSRGVRISGRLVRADGRPLIEASLYAMPSGFEQRYGQVPATVGPTGYFEISGLEGSAFDLYGSIWDRDTAMVLRATHLEVPGGSTELVLVLDAPPVLSTFVGDLNGLPVSDYRLFADCVYTEVRDPENEDLWRGILKARKARGAPGLEALSKRMRRRTRKELHVIATNGVGEWEGLSMGEWTLWAEGADGQLSKSVKVTIKPGTTWLDLYLELGKQLDDEKR